MAAFKRINAVALVMVLVITTFSIGAMSQSSTSNCNTVLLTMSSCLDYITGKSPTPQSTCCSALENVVQNNPICLCQILNSGGSQLGITINTTLALSLPTKCKVRTPPVSRCRDVLAPASAPLPGPAGSSNSGSRGVPGNDASSSVGRLADIRQIQLLGFFLFLASSYVVKSI